MSISNQTARLRPVERRVLDMKDQGISLEEIAARMRRSPEFIERLITWTQIPRESTPSRSTPTPLQRVVLQRRAKGETHEEIGETFKRSGRFIRQVEGLAHFQKGVDLLSESAAQARAGGTE